ncbi:MFS transporter [Campylobacter sp. RM9344]|uniref:MFS transporter n=1 Tax=Campylobacter californiensis TaxID=1032243 RepID=A0AAW3ZTN5_9BACT|nr:MULTISPECIES: MFS transporter [unclassified Campylobacter]MBE2984959.1 MFS transporter [Campylobacter sp. RM6883]MBE2986694.1 MFS transporter [Campylobacter sp. RM12919]MBE2988781.1 MFS transporter [Campylobacter sp. RM12920]MBE2995401.1 MFS transporter [Campylobacter sp. RM6913]MBE3029972.1 MFS transporter [Campylobacter sp. RM9344]
MQKYIYKIFSLNKGEFWLLLYSTLFIFALFASYALLRPIRDALGLTGGKEELKWLFLGTFIATLVASMLAMWLSGSIKRKRYTDCIFIFFALNLVGFYVAIRAYPEGSGEFLYLSRTFYIWVSVFNLFVISTAWSLLADVFSKDRSKRLFGIISAGASIGSIAGASAVSFLKVVSVEEFIFASIALLAVTLGLKNLIIYESGKLLTNEEEQSAFKARFDAPIGSKNPFAGFNLIIKSKFLMAFVGFILLLTSVSTFLYMEQARIIKELFPTSQARAAAFANIDLIVQTSSFIIQIFLTAKIAKIFGIRWLLSLLGFVVGAGFILLAFTHPAFLPLVVVMSIRRVGEYAMVKPAREMLFVPLDSESKYKVKNFLDTVVYRGGDAVSAQAESALAKFGVSVALLGGAAISFVWGMLGMYLGKEYDKDRVKENRGNSTK